MTFFKKFKTSIVFFIFSTLLFAETVEDPCAGESRMIALINRPTVADTACVVPQHHSMVEMGGVYELMTQNLGNLKIYPETLYRLGLGQQTEIDIQSPNFVQPSHFGAPKLTATSVGVKHEIGHTAKWLGTVETIMTLPSGSREFGSAGLGVGLNGILVYTYSPQWVFVTMMGMTTETLPSLQGGRRYNSFNPDVVLNYLMNDDWELFIEVYGQTKTSPIQGAGFNTDMGLVWQASKNLAFDVEYGHRLSGQLVGFEYYVGAGVSVFF
jgi:hypothetical protein